MKSWTSKMLALPAVALIAGATVLPASAQYVYYDSYPSYSYYTTSYPAVVGGTTYVDPYYSNYGYRRSRVGSAIGNAAVGAGVGALGGLAAGAIFDRRNIGRAAGIGAGIGAGLGLLRGVLGGGGGGYWY